MSRMELVLKKPVEELIPELIAWNNKELMAAVQGSLKKYEGKVYDDKSISEAKADRAQLNRFSKALNDERIQIRKVYEEPYSKFKSEVDEVIHLVNSTADAINIQIREYEVAKEDEKRENIVAYFNEKIGGLAELVSYEKIHSPKWLNASVSLKSCFSEIDAKIEQIRNEFETITALKSEDEATIKAYYFRSLSLSAALMANEQLKAERQRIAAAKARTDEIAEAQAPEVVPAPQEPPKEPSQTLEQTFTLRFAVEGTRTQLHALKEFLQGNNIKYKAI